MTWFAFALLAALFLGVASLFEKRILLQEHSLEFSAVFSLLVAVCSLPFLFFVGPITMSAQALAAIGVASFFSAISFYYTAKCVRHMEISVIAPLLVIAPAVTVLLAFVFLGEALSAWQVWGVGLLLCGAYMLQAKRGTHVLAPLRQIIRSRYAHWLGIALIGYGISDVVTRKALTDYHVPAPLFLVLIQIFVALILCAMWYRQSGTLRKLQIAYRRVGWFMGILVVLTVLHRYFQVEATTIAFVGLVSAVKRSSAFFVALIGGELFHESHMVRKAIASAIIICGVLFVIL